MGDLHHSLAVGGVARAGAGLSLVPVSIRKNGLSELALSTGTRILPARHRASRINRLELNRFVGLRGYGY